VYNSHKQGRATAAIFTTVGELRYCCSSPKLTAECLKLHSSGIINSDPRSFGDEKQHTSSPN